MRLLLLFAFLCSSCAYRSGATYSGFGDGKGYAGNSSGKLSEWKDFTFGTDLEGAEVTPAGMKIAKQDQSKVANQFIKTGGQAIAAYVGADVIKSVTDSNNAVTTAESTNALRSTQAKEVTKRVDIKSKAATEALKIEAATVQP